MHWSDPSTEKIRDGSSKFWLMQLSVWGDAAISNRILPAILVFVADGADDAAHADRPPRISQSYRGRCGAVAASPRRLSGAAIRRVGRAPRVLRESGIPQCEDQPRRATSFVPGTARR